MIRIAPSVVIGVVIPLVGDPPITGNVPNWRKPLPGTAAVHADACRCHVRRNCVECIAMHSY